MIEEQNINQLPEDWKWVKLSNIGKIETGNTPSKNSSEYYGKEIPFFKPTDLQQGINTVTASDNLSKLGFEKTRKLPKDSILVTCIGATIGKTGLTRVEGTSNQQINSIIPDELHNPKFVFYQVISYSFQNQIKNNASSTTLPILNKSKFSQLNFATTTPRYQQAIVSKIEELFSELDKGIEQLKTAQQQLKTYRQSVLKWAFEGKLTEEWRRNKVPQAGIEPALRSQVRDLSCLQQSTTAAEPKVIYKKNNGLPEGWKRVELKEVCEIKRGKSKHRPRNEPKLYGGKYPFIQTGDIRNAAGRYITEYSQTYSELGFQQSKLWPKGTLCITIAANIGETAILGFDSCFPDSVVGLLCNERLLLNKYTNYFFISFKQKLEELAPATAQKNINVDILEKVEIPLPSVEEQNNIVQEIESRLSVADKMEESISQSLQQAEALRQSILKKAFEGRLV